MQIWVIIGKNPLKRLKITTDVSGKILNAKQSNLDPCLHWMKEIRRLGPCLQRTGIRTGETNWIPDTRLRGQRHKGAKGQRKIY